MSNEHNKEIVQLIIDAKNLSNDELTEAAEQLQGLSRTALRAEKALADIEVKQGALDSFRELKEQLNKARNAVAVAEVDFKKLSSSIKNNKNATDQQKQSLELAKIQLKQQRKELASLQSTYDKSLRDIKQFGAHSRNLVQVSQELEEAHKKQAQEVDRLNAELAKQTNTVNQQIESEKRRIGVTGELNDEIRKQIEQERKAAEAKEREQEEAYQLAITLKKYEQRLASLNQEKKKGTISSGDYIRQEDELRQQLGLTSAQVSKSRQAVEADAKGKGQATKSTESLSKATRRLAKVYALLISAQSAVSAVRESTKAYGESEAAITKVEKTTGQAREAVSAMYQELSVLSQEIMPTSTNELARYAEVAGQLGVKSTTDMMNLVTAADALNVSTNLAGDEAAMLLARILSMTGEGIPKIHNLASSVVELGNNFAVSEDEIVHMTKEIVTGTSAIKLGSAAAAAFGTVLKESGQQAERSRSGFTRLSQTILQAVQNGGKDLDRLSKLTGVAADEIEQHLGELPEEVLYKLIKGFSEAKDSGELLSGILRDMGIDSQETLEVMEVLSNKVGRLRYGIDLSSKANIKHTAHLEEAAKAYANQESQIARLINQFSGLKRAVGTALSDELDSGVRATSALMETLEQSIVTVMNEVGNITSGFGELIDTFDDATEVIGGFAGGALDALLKSGLNNVTMLFNNLTLAISGAALAINELKIYAKEATGASEEELEKLREVSRKLAKGMERDVKDIGNSWDKFTGKSSSAYEDFQQTYKKYGNAVSSLGEEQQKQLAELIKANGYVEKHEQAYIDLSAALVRANREEEIRTRMLEQNVKQAEKRAQQEREEVARNKALLKQAEELNLTRQQITEQQEALSKANAEGAISAIEYKNKVDLLTVAEERLIEKQSAHSTQRKIAISQNSQLSDSVRDLKLAEIELDEAIWHLDNQLKGNIKNDTEKLRLTLERIDAERDLKLVQEKLAIQQELESKRHHELADIREKNALALERLKSKYEANIITYGEYAREKEKLELVTRVLTNALGDESDAEDRYRNTKNASNQVIRAGIGLTRESTAAIREQAEQVRKATQHINLFASAHNNLNKQFDFSNTSTQQLKERYDELQGAIMDNQRVTSGWWRDLAQESNAAFAREQQIISQTLHMRELTEQINSGSVSLDKLDTYARQASQSFSLLGQSDLSNYLRQIEAARAELQQLQRETASTTASAPSPAYTPALNPTVQTANDTVVIRLESGSQSAQVQGNRQAINDIIRVLREAGLNVA
ncbi:phage tail tape measure protein [Pseudoalteromonas sp. DL2-H2.2]|uniref:phage tail tape measure protein n=1 Tax=Pseudoalteromonas sp. DL2-H2.2 TaxID=2908889 RepID=UPI001F2AEA26|nr:phage tail tape measure protein [Pseudoalteromonas sp. DL2-H2.2]MCF2909992.1 phage tail tape measure protein [Pseudoalteromonas sp. DL2-H2.2]